MRARGELADLVIVSVRLIEDGSLTLSAWV